MTFFRLICIAIISLALFFFTGCSSASEDEISADEIIEDVEKAMGDGESDDLSADDASTFNEEFDELEDKTSAPSAYRPSFSDDGRYVVQVKVFASRRAAERLANQLADEGYPSYVAEVADPTPDLSGTFYRVRIGNFGGVSLAEEFGEKVVLAMGHQYWVDNKSNDSRGSEASGGGGYDASYSAPAVSEPATSTWESSSDWGAGTGSTPAASEPAPAAEPEPAPAAEPATAPAAEPATGTDDWGTGTTEPSSSGSDFDF